VAVMYNKALCLSIHPNCCSCCRKLIQSTLHIRPCDPLRQPPNTDCAHCLTAAPTDQHNPRALLLWLPLPLR
jgi:hypothetical protein